MQSSDRRNRGARPLKQTSEWAAIASYSNKVRGVRRCHVGTSLAKQSLFKVYNQTLRKLGDNDFIVERKGVSARQGAGTLERVVKYDQEAFTKAWDYLAKSPSDGEDDQQKQKKSNLKKKNPALFYPWKRAKIRPFWGRTTSFGRSHMLGGAWRKKKTGSD